MKEAARYITAIIACILAVGCIYAQRSGSGKEQRIIEAFLDSAPGIHGSNLNFNDFFSNSYVTAIVKANDDGKVEKIRIKKCRTTPSGNCDEYSMEGAEKLLIECSKSIINNSSWKPGTNSCRIEWKPRHNRNIDREVPDGEMMNFINGLITDKTRRRLYKNEGSAYISLKIDSTGYILDAEYVGNIFWGTGTGGYITDLSVDLSTDYREYASHTTMVFRPRLQPTRYMNEEETRLYKADKQLRKNAKQIARELKGKRFGALAGKAGEICIEVYIDTSDFEIEESQPVYPGGAKAVKEYYVKNFRYNRILRRNNVKGIVKVRLLIKKNGKAEALFVETREQPFSYEGKDRWEKIEKEIYDEVDRLTKKMPRWTPGRYDGKNIRTECRFSFRLDGID